MKYFGGTLLFVGFFLLMGAAGTGDLQSLPDFHGTLVPFWLIASQGIIGAILMLIGALAYTKSSEGGGGHGARTR